MQADAGAEGRPAALAPFVGQPAAGVRRLQGRAHGIGDMVGIGLGRVPEGHDAVADILVDHAAIARDRRPQRLEVARQPAGQELGLDAFADAREALDVGEHHGEVAPRAAQPRRVSGERMIWRNQVLRHVAAEHLQPLAHALDGVGQAADLGDVAPDRRGVGEVEMADALGLGGEPRRRARHQQRGHQHGQDREADRDRRPDRRAVRAARANRPTAPRPARRRRW